MFCSKCGAVIEDSTRFCPDCGQEVNHKKSSRHVFKIILIFGVLLLLGVFALLVMNSFSVHSSPEKVAVAIVEGEFEADIDKMVRCLPDFRLRQLASRYGLSPNSSRNEIANKIKADYRYQTPTTVDIVYTEVIDRYDIEDLSYLRNYYDYMSDDEYESITEVAQVNVDFIVDGEDKSMKLICIKMKNKWYYLY